MSTKRILSLVLALVMVLGTFGTVFAAPTASDKLAFLLENGVLKEGKADQNLKRRDSVVLLSRLMKEEAAAATHPASDKYDDIDDAFYNGYIGWATAKGYVNGKENAKFDPNGPLTAQAFATMLLRALGYQEGDKDLFDEAYAVGTDLGIFDDVEVGEKEVVTRGDMAAMTYNALGVKMNDGSGKTLAEVLGIEMPVVEPEVVEVVDVRADNLKEIKVELNTLKGLDLRALTNAKNYRTDAGEVKEIFLDENTVVAVLKDGVSMTQNANYKLTVRDVKGVEFVDKAFKAFDNTAPQVEEVVVLGSMGIRVRMSEPVKNADERSFLLDGKTFVSTVKTDGRDITIMPYPNFKEFDNFGKQVLTVNAQEDFAGYKSANFTEEVDIQRDETKPVVENIEVTNNSVIVTFVDEVYPPSVSKTNASWTQYGYATVTEADEAKVLSGKRVEYVFKGAKELPKPRVDLTVQGVKNYSDVAMDKHVENVLVDSDFARPEIVTWALLDDADTTEGQMRLVFNKDLEEATVKDTSNYVLYNAEALKPTVKDGDAIKGAVINARLERGSKNVVIVTLHSEKLVEGQNYILEVKGVRDNTTLRNLMIPKEIAFTDGIGKALHVVSATANTLETEITLVFNKQLDRLSAEDLANYRIKTKTSDKEFTLKEISQYAKVTLHKDGKVVTIELPNNLRSLERVRVSSSVMALDGHRYTHTNPGVNGRLDNNWVVLGGVRVEWKSVVAGGVKVVSDNKELELAFNLPIVRLDANAKNHIIVEKTSDNTPVGVKNVHLENGVVIVELTTALEDGEDYRATINGAFGYSQYGMSVLGASREFDTNYANAPKIVESKVTVNSGGDVVVEVKFDQPMQYKMTTNTAGDPVWETSMHNLSIVDNSTTGKKVSFEDKSEFSWSVATNTLIATFTDDEAALLRNSNGFNYSIVSETGKPVYGVNEKALAVGSKPVEEVHFVGPFGSLTVDAPNSDVYTNGNINILVINGIKKNSLYIKSGIIGKLSVAAIFEVKGTAGIANVERVVATKTGVELIVAGSNVSLDKDVPVKIDASGSKKEVKLEVTKVVYGATQTTVTFEVKADDENVKGIQASDIVVKINDKVPGTIYDFKEDENVYTFLVNGKYTAEEVTVELR